MSTTVEIRDWRGHALVKIRADDPDIQDLIDDLVWIAHQRGLEVMDKSSEDQDLEQSQIPTLPTAG